MSATKHSKAPWTQDQYGNVVDFDGDRILLHGVALSMGADAVADANRDLLTVSPEMLAFIKNWRDIIIGGDKLKNVEPWARQFAEEADRLIARATVSQSTQASEGGDGR